MIEVKNISYSYGSKAILHDISLTFKDGEITVIIGANGCGKSTLIKLCAGHLSTVNGKISVDELDLFSHNSSNKKIAQKIAYMPQSRNMSTPDMTVETLVLHGRFPWLGYPRVYRKDDIDKSIYAMKQAGILHKKQQLLTQISGGERQKAYFAMALAQLPENGGHILLDEPTSHLDISVQIELISLLKELKKSGRCVVAVLHDINAALEIADKIAVIKDGKLLINNTPEGVLKTEAIEEAFGVTRKEKSQWKWTIRH